MGYHHLTTVCFESLMIAELITLQRGRGDTTVMRDGGTPPERGVVGCSHQMVVAYRLPLHFFL